MNPRPWWPVERAEAPAVPTTADEAAEPFKCEPHRCTLSGAACAARWHKANSGPPPAATGRLRSDAAQAVYRATQGACVDCDAGKARHRLLGDEPEVRLPARPDDCNDKDQEQPGGDAGDEGEGMGSRTKSAPPVPPALRTGEWWDAARMREACAGLEGFNVSETMYRIYRKLWREEGLIERRGKGPRTEHRWLGEPVEAEGQLDESHALGVDPSKLAPKAEVRADALASCRSMSPTDRVLGGPYRCDKLAGHDGDHRCGSFGWATRTSPSAAESRAERQLDAGLDRIESNARELDEKVAADVAVSLRKNQSNGGVYRGSKRAARHAELVDALGEAALKVAALTTWVEGLCAGLDMSAADRVDRLALTAQLTKYVADPAEELAELIAQLFELAEEINQ